MPAHSSHSANPYVVASLHTTNAEEQAIARAKSKMAKRTLDPDWDWECDLSASFLSSLLFRTCIHDFNGSYLSF